jgi:uncharacterized protein DUF1501
VQGEPDGSNALGRDHHNKAFTMWLAGGGFKPGITIGETDELGFNVAQDPVHVHDLTCDDPSPPGLRSHETDLLFSGARLPVD